MGCGAPTMSRAVRHERVTARAGFDLGCRGPIQVVEIDENTYGAIGCGHRASYVLRGCMDGNHTWACTILLNGTSEGDAPVTVQALEQ